MTHRTPAMQADVSDREHDGAGFGARLRRERERHNLSIAAVAQRTKILGALIIGLENDDLSRWPCGFYRRGFFRAYATAIGLDAEPLLREFLRRFPDPEDVAAAAATTDATAARTGQTPLVRLTLAEEQSWFKRGRVLRGVSLRCAVVAFDLVVLSGIAVTGFAVLDLFWAPLAIAATALLRWRHRRAREHTRGLPVRIIFGRHSGTAARRGSRWPAGGRGPKMARRDRKSDTRLTQIRRSRKQSQARRRQICGLRCARACCGWRLSADSADYAEAALRPSRQPQQRRAARHALASRRNPEIRVIRDIRGCSARCHCCPPVVRALSDASISAADAGWASSFTESRR